MMLMAIVPLLSLAVGLCALGVAGRPVFGPAWLIGSVVAAVPPVISAAGFAFREPGQMSGIFDTILTLSLLVSAPAAAVLAVIFAVRQRAG
jgi:hypothetical protein